MFKHNLLIIYRNFGRFKGTFFINLIGLSTGLACALLIYLWVHDELSVDKFHQKDGLLYQVMQNYPLADGVLTIEATPGILAEALVEEMPEIEEGVVATTPKGDRGGQAARGIISADNRHVKATELYVSRNYLKVFSYPLMEGNPDEVLVDNHSVVLSDEVAMKLFDTTENLIGRTIVWDQGRLSGDYLISGIFKKPPVNSTVHFDLLFNYNMWLGHYPHLQDWRNSDPATFIVLKPGTDLDRLNGKIANFMQSKYRQRHGTQYLENVGTLFLQHYSDKYLYNHFEDGVQAGGRIDYVRLFSLIAVFILAIACINFMNLSTARAARRLKEVGIKKAVGVSRKALVVQYLAESLAMSFLSLLLAILIVELLLPQFNEITGKQLSHRLDTFGILSVLTITLFTGLLSGSYPAFYLSGFNPAAILKGKIHSSTSELWTRKGLVIFQFVMTITMIVSVTVVHKQIQFVHTKSLGYDKDNVISFKREGKLNESLETFLTEVKKMPGVVGASSFGHDLTGDYGLTSGLAWPGKHPDTKIEFGNLEVDHGLMELLDFQMAEGRMFSREFGAEGSNIIFNEAAVAAMGLKHPVGTTVKLWGEERQIVGVVKDFHFESLYEEVKPCFLRCHPNQRNILVKIKAGMERETLERIRTFYSEFNEELPFEYRFLDDDYQALYASEQRVAVLSRYSAGIAILISCLGLFGLAAFTAERRLKEVGIRKVLGSSVFGIIRLLSGDFTKMVITSIAVALPVSYLLAANWLGHFAYRIDLEPWYFVSAALLALVTAWLTVGAQALKAANVNPVQCLRDE